MEWINKNSLAEHGKVESGVHTLRAKWWMERNSQNGENYCLFLFWVGFGQQILFCDPSMSGHRDWVKAYAFSNDKEEAKSMYLKQLDLICL